MKKEILKEIREPGKSRKKKGQPKGRRNGFLEGLTGKDFTAAGLFFFLCFCAGCSSCNTAYSAPRLTGSASTAPLPITSESGFTRPETSSRISHGIWEEVRIFTVLPTTDC